MNEESRREEANPSDELRGCFRSLESLVVEHAALVQKATSAYENATASADRLYHDSCDDAERWFLGAIAEANATRDAAVSAGENRMRDADRLIRDTQNEMEKALGEDWLSLLRSIPWRGTAIDDPDEATLRHLSYALRFAIPSPEKSWVLRTCLWLRDHGMSWLGFLLYRWRCEGEVVALLGALHRFDRSAERAKQQAGAAIGNARRDFIALEAEIAVKQDAATRHAESERARSRASAEQRRESSTCESLNAWRSACIAVADRMLGVSSSINRRFPDWSELPRAIGQPVDRLPNAIPFASVPADLGEFLESAGSPHPVPPEARLATIPALLPFPGQPSLLLVGDESSKGPAVSCLQALILRIITALPPGKVRLTMIDPLGLGKSFAQFMHLADYDELLVTSSIWTETREIERELEGITDHMRMVIQKYLRGEYSSITEYNAEAGEVAEPFRFLVVANYPAKFSPSAAERLLSIASSGASCGVYVLMSRDSTQELPRGFNIKDLENSFTVAEWHDGRFHIRDELLGRWPALLPAQPPTPLFTELLKIVGEKAKNANKVEVPFSTVVPPDMALWEGSARSGLSVPIGRVGARRLQMLELGKGTAQHALVAGKTGSGKSTLLHAIITNLGLHYSPDEVELYLVDFKKGVEFKPYATRGLPHARVIAIESEREFGLSVLRRLDEELHARGEWFRFLGAQDIAAYRAAGGAKRCPRIVLIVDEFQEFFVEDDKVARESALLLDRLVRQGRAFGIHVVLGSQTLGGAYSLARATIDQMAVRIALQCSETDARLVLGDDNAAARLLSRPGEAIYNDANGRVDGNTVFQVAWLPDQEREVYLQALAETQRSAADASGRRPPAIVFEGNIPADIKSIPAADGHLAFVSPPTPHDWVFWLGEPTAIKEPTSAILRRQSGCNLLMVGNSDEIAVALTCAWLLSIARQHVSLAASGAKGARVVLFDGTPGDSRHAGVVSGCVQSLPFPVRTIARRDSAKAIAELAEEVRRRTDAGTTDADSVFLILNGIHYLRDLRRTDGLSAYGSTKTSEGSSAAADMAAILRDGPPCGVHSGVWVDTFSNVSRTLDRQALRDFELRIVMQMSGADSANLVDSPAAAKLGGNRAYLYHDALATLEKFRPYGPPGLSTMLSLCGAAASAGHAPLQMRSATAPLPVPDIIGRQGPCERGERPR